jgi:hypothetical protein
MVVILQLLAPKSPRRRATTEGSWHASAVLNFLRAEELPRK